MIKENIKINFREKFDKFYDHWKPKVITELNDYTSQTDGESIGEPEGLAFKNGYVLVSNGDDPSVALLKSSWAK